ncbi:MAG: alpha/beta hydrolase [Candidatus Hodarchaeota archaeon]
MSISYDEAVAPFEYGEGSDYVIALHGYTGSPYELRQLGQYLATHGFHVLAPCLPGHGKKKEELIKTRWTDWWDFVRQIIETINAQEPKHVFITGLSLGGALSLYAAAQYSIITAVAPICALVNTKRMDRLLFNLVGKRFTYIPTRKKSYYYFDVQDRSLLEDPIFQEYYERFNKEPAPVVASIFELLDNVKQELPKIKQPTLLFQARKDRMILPSSGSFVLEQIGTSPEEKALIWLEQSGHVATMDYNKEQVFLNITQFFERYCK